MRSYMSPAPYVTPSPLNNIIIAWGPCWQEKPLPIQRLLVLLQSHPPGDLLAVRCRQRLGALHVRKQPMQGQPGAQGRRSVAAGKGARGKHTQRDQRRRHNSLHCRDCAHVHVTRAQDGHLAYLLHRALQVVLAVAGDAELQSTQH